MNRIDESSSREGVPSTSLLMAFESVCRTGSACAASSDLKITQGAVSRLVQNLETQLGVPLFHRSRRRLIPTPSALAYARSINNALQLIRCASSQVKLDSSTQNVSAFVPSELGIWLMPYLHKFVTQGGSITLNLKTAIKRMDFDSENLDIAVHTSPQIWTGMESVHLFEEELIPVCSPKLLSAAAIRSAHDITRLPLLCAEDGLDPWKSWACNHDIPMNGIRSMSCSEIPMAIQAAVHGLGIALIPKFAVKQHIRNGCLSRMCEESLQPGKSYYLIYRKGDNNYQPIRVFTHWLSTIVRDDMHAEH